MNLSFIFSGLITILALAFITIYYYVAGTSIETHHEINKQIINESTQNDPPSPSPVLTPTPTPSPSEPNYFGYRTHMSVMDPADLEIYFERLKGKEVKHWTGKIRKKLFLDDGYYGMTIEMDENPVDRPDIVLTKMDETLLENYNAGQAIRFSGMIAGHTNVDNMPRIMALKDVVIHE